MRVVHGKVEPVDLVSSREEFEFPAPIGKRRIYTVTEHPDIVTIPQYCGKDIHVCEEKFGWFLGDLTVEDIWIKGLQQATSKQGSAVTPVNIMEEMSSCFMLPTEYGRLVKEGKLREHYASYTVEVNGWKDDKFVSHIIYYNADLKTAQHFLPVWGSPPVYATIGGTPIERARHGQRTDQKEGRLPHRSAGRGRRHERYGLLQQRIGKTRPEYHRKDLPAGRHGRLTPPSYQKPGIKLAC